MAAFDLKSLTDKLPGILKNVKAMVSAETPIPENAKDDPISYLLTEMTKSLKAIEAIRDAAAKEKQKLDAIAGDLYREWQAIKALTAAPAGTTTPTIQTAAASSALNETTAAPQETVKTTLDTGGTQTTV